MEEKDLFATWKRFVSDCVRNAPLLHLNSRDTRTVMSQNAHGIATNNSMDVLTDVLNILELKGWLQAGMEMTPPWRVDFLTSHDSIFHLLSTQLR